MSDILEMIEASVMRLLADQWDDGASRGYDGAWPGKLWDQLSELGLNQLVVAEERGGAGLSLADGLTLLKTISAHPYPVPLPIVETLLASHFLDSAGIAVPDAAITIGPARPDELLSLARNGDSWTVSGTLTRIPWARDVSLIAAAARVEGSNDEAIALLMLDGATITPGMNLAGEPRDMIGFDGSAVQSVGLLPGALDCVLEAGAAARTVQIAAACRLALELSVEHAKTRSQFGRPIGKFQAVQQNLAAMTGQTVAAAGGADIAIDAIRAGQAFPGVGFGKARAGMAAGLVSAIAHQTFGAMGYADEHVLHRITKRLLSWRDEMGAESYWTRRIGQEAVARGGSQFWRMVSGT